MILLECVGGPFDGQKRELFPGSVRLFVGLKGEQTGLTQLENEIPAELKSQRVGVYELVLPKNPRLAFLAWMGE